MSRCITFALLAAASGVTYAGSSAIVPGSSLTTGVASNHFSIYGNHQNPAAGDTLIRPDENWRVNFAPSVTVGAEVGPVDNFLDDLDELIEILDNPSANHDDIQETLDRFNSTLTAIGDHGYLRVDTHLAAPFFPLHWRPEFVKGTFTAELNVTGQAHLSVLDDELAFDPQNQRFTTSTAAYIKSGVERAVGLSYSRPLLPENDHGQVFLGVKLNGYQLDLSKQVFLLQQLDGRDSADLVRDEYDRNVGTSTGIGLDLGLLWKSDRVTSGFSVRNVNEPKFEFGPVGVNCGELGDDTDERSNCEAANAFADAGEIARRETHTKFAVATLDNTVWLNSRWSLGSAIDLADYTDMVGDEHRLISAATAYYPKSVWVPALRLGYRKNMAGSELSSITAGTTLLGSLNLDIEWGLDSVTVDGQSAPRRFALALSFEERF